nr:protein ABHD17C isoform X2 [Ipomoea trifida]
MRCLISQLAAKLTFFPPSPATYQVKTRDDGRVVAVSATSAAPISGAADDPSLDVLLLDTKSAPPVRKPAAPTRRNKKRTTQIDIRALKTLLYPFVA